MDVGELEQVDFGGRSSDLELATPGIMTAKSVAASESTIPLPEQFVDLEQGLTETKSLSSKPVRDLAGKAAESILTPDAGPPPLKPMQIQLVILSYVTSSYSSRPQFIPAS